MYKSTVIYFIRQTWNAKNQRDVMNFIMCTMGQKNKINSLILKRRKIIEYLRKKNACEVGAKALPLFKIKY